MQYRVESVPDNTNILRIRVFDQPLIRNPRKPFFVSYVHGAEKGEKKITEESPCAEKLLSFARTVARLDGVTGQIGFHQHWIDLGRDGSVSVDELAGHVENALVFLTKDGTLTRKEKEKIPVAPLRLRLG